MLNLPYQTRLLNPCILALEADTTKEGLQMSRDTILIAISWSQYKMTLAIMPPSYSSVQCRPNQTGLSWQEPRSKARSLFFFLFHLIVIGLLSHGYSILIFKWVVFVFIHFKSKQGHQRKSNSNRFIPRALQEDTSSKNIVWSPQKHCCTANGSCILYASTLQSQRSLWMCILFRWSSVYSIDRAQLQHNTNGFVLWQRIIPSTPTLPTYNPGRPLQGQLHLCGRVRFVSFSWM